MSKAVLLSIKPKYCELIANGKKTVEVRKTRPKLETPFKVYIYCTKAKEFFSIGGGVYVASDELYRLPTGEIKFGDSFELLAGWAGKYDNNNFYNGKVIGEFVCDTIFPMWDGYAGNCGDDCLSFGEREEYLNGEMGYGFHISNLVIYNKPKELEEFKKPELPLGLRYENDIITRPPQSWCYVESEDSE